MTDSSTPAPMAETPDAERLLNEDEPAGPGSVVDRLRTRAEAFETRPAMHDGFTYTADDAKLDRDAIAALRAPASPPVQDAGELVGRLRNAEGALTGATNWIKQSRGRLFGEAAAEIERLAALIKDYEDVLADKRRLAREIDVAMHGEDGAAKQPSLCDLIAPAERLRASATKAEADLAEARAALVDPDMPAQQLHLHMGELTASEARVARAAIRWANTHLTPEKADV